MKIKEIIDFLERIAPSALQESYDNSGLLIGDAQGDAEKALICLDLTMDVMQEAIDEGYDLIISHHPLIFSGIKKLTGNDEIEKMIILAIQKNVAIYSIHTNLDNVNTGVNAMLCQRLGVLNPEILQPMSGVLRKLVTFCPEDQTEKLRSALFAAGAGHIGNYDSCSFSSQGIGTFRAGEGANPFVGEIGELHSEKEARIEIIFPAWIEGTLIAALKSNHPYEEVAYDIYPLNNVLGDAGAGMIGVLKDPMDEMSFLHQIKKSLSVGCIRHSALTGNMIRKVAVCGGSGSFLISKAMKAGADIFVSADIKYHQFFEAEGKMIIADAGHYETEQFTKELIYNTLNEKFPTFALRISHRNTNAIHYL